MDTLQQKAQEAVSDSRAASGDTSVKAHAMWDQFLPMSLPACLILAILAYGALRSTPTEFAQYFEKIVGWPTVALLALGTVAATSRGRLWSQLGQVMDRVQTVKGFGGELSLRERIEQQSERIETQKNALENQKSAIEDQKTAIEDQKTVLLEQQSTLAAQRNEIEVMRTYLDKVVLFSMSMFIFGILKGLFECTKTQQSFVFRDDGTMRNDIKFLIDNGYLNHADVWTLSDGEDVSQRLTLTPLGEIYVRLRTREEVRLYYENQDKPIGYVAPVTDI